MVRSVGRVYFSRFFKIFFLWFEDERFGFLERRRYFMWEEWYELRFRGRNE